MILGQNMEREMREQPQVLQSNAQSYLQSAEEAIRKQKPKMILLAARGSSDNAALYARYLIEIHLQIPVSLAAPSVITKYKSQIQYPDCLAIGISQSGAAPDVSEVLAYMREQGHKTIAITNTAGSRLTQTAEHTILLNAGSENSIAATKTYSASLLALVQVIRALGAEIPDPISAIPTDEWLDKTSQVAADNSGHLVRNSPIFCLGRGYNYCTALESALKLMECSLLSAKSYSTADFEHGPKALAAHGTASIIFGEVPESIKTTGTTLIQDPNPDQGIYAPLKSIIFGQWLALYSARARGLDPDQAQNLSKVTKTL